MAAEIPLSQAVEEYLSWLELDRHAAEGTGRMNSAPAPLGSVAGS
jgi:hypothetical protein